MGRLPATGNGQAAGAETGFGAAGADIAAGLAIGFFLRAFFFAFFFAGFLAFFAFFLAGFLAFFFAALLFLPERRFAFLAGFFAFFFAGRRFLADFFLPEDFFLEDFFAALLFAAISNLLMKVKQRELPALRRLDLLGANCQCPAARHIGRMTGHRAVLLAADEDLQCPQHDPCEKERPERG